MHTAEFQPVNARPHAGEPHHSEALEYMAVYDGLLRRGMTDMFTSFFPQTRRFFGERWVEIVDDYRAANPIMTCQIPRAAEAFPAFLQTAPIPVIQETLEHYPFLSCLAEYEWMDVMLQNAPDIPLAHMVIPWVPEPDEQHTMQWHPSWNPISRIEVFEYPVSNLLARLKELEDESLEPEQFSDISATPQALLLYRDPDTLQVRHVSVNPLMASLLDCGRKSTTYEAAIRLLHQVEPGLAAFSLDRVRHQAIEMLQECLNQRILLGSCITED